jgi:enoyl-[acyl-carrier protein] reductase I
MFSLSGKKALVVGIANDQSIAYGCTKAFGELGAKLAVTYRDARSEPHVRPLAEQLGAELQLRARGHIAV